VAEQVVTCETVTASNSMIFEKFTGLFVLHGLKGMPEAWEVPMFWAKLDCCCALRLVSTAVGPSDAATVSQLQSSASHSDRTRRMNRSKIEHQRGGEARSMNFYKAHRHARIARFLSGGHPARADSVPRAVWPMLDRRIRQRGQQSGKYSSRTVLMCWYGSPG
jgi:hypothetical protein